MTTQAAMALHPESPKGGHINAPQVTDSLVPCCDHPDFFWLHHVQSYVYRIGMSECVGNLGIDLPTRTIFIGTMVIIDHPVFSWFSIGFPHRWDHQHLQLGGPSRVCSQWPGLSGALADGPAGPTRATETADLAGPEQDVEGSPGLRSYQLWMLDEQIFHN